MDVYNCVRCEVIKLKCYYHQNHFSYKNCALANHECYPNVHGLVSFWNRVRGFFRARLGLMYHHFESMFLFFLSFDQGLPGKDGETGEPGKPGTRVSFVLFCIF